MPFFKTFHYPMQENETNKRHMEYFDFHTCACGKIENALGFFLMTSTDYC